MIIQDREKLKIPCLETSIEECRNLGIFAALHRELFDSPTPGLGLAANQIGIPIQACIIKNVSKNKDQWPNEWLRMVNPKLSDFLLPFVNQNEGCLSFPNIRLNTNRFEQVTCSWIDFDTGRSGRTVFYGEWAVVLQHEVDHLLGMTMWDRQVKPQEKIGRNDPCPFCFKMGLQIKYKKCKEHFKE